jgi:hypothetical protein
MGDIMKREAVAATVKMYPTTLVEVAGSRSMVKGQPLNTYLTILQGNRHEDGLTIPAQEVTISNVQEFIKTLQALVAELEEKV